MNILSTQLNFAMANIYAKRNPIYVIPARGTSRNGLLVQHAYYFEPVTANKSYEDTEFHQALIVNADSLGYTFDNNDDRPERIVKTFFAAISSYLSKRKVSKEDEAVALVLQDTAGIFKFAGIVEYVDAYVVIGIDDGDMGVAYLLAVSHCSVGEEHRPEAVGYECIV